MKQKNNSEVYQSVYDEQIVGQDLQVLADNYYEPKVKSMQRRVEIVLNAIKPDKGERVLDAGCGVGTFVFHSSRRAAAAFGIDYSYETIKTAEALVEKYGPSDFRPIFVVANAKRIPFKDGTFNKIISADFVEHISEDEKQIFLSEIRRVLKDGGSVVIFTPNGIRERIGRIYRKLKNIIWNEKFKFNTTHFGLTERHKFESLLKQLRFDFRLQYHDITRPYLARIPIIRRFLALNLLWIIQKL